MAQRIKESNPELLTTREVANTFKVSINTVFKWAKDGRINVVRTPGGGLRFYKSEVARAKVTK